MRKITITITKNQNVYSALLDNCVSKAICTSLRKRMGLVQVERCGKIVDLRLVDQVFQGEVVWYFLEEKAKSIEKYDLKIDIVYEDEDLAVIDKPSGIATIPSKKHYGKSLMNALANEWGDFVFRPVNRLDRDTSGLMIVAKNQLVHSLLSKEKIYREYEALIEGCFEGEIEIDLPIAVVGVMKRGVRADGKSAKTKMWCIENYSNYTRVGLKLYTGRTHQIRVHTSHIGHPILCDKLYNPNCQDVTLDSGVFVSTQTLHSCKIEFIHPISGQEIKLNSKPKW